MHSVILSYTENNAFVQNTLQMLRSSEYFKVEEIQYENPSPSGDTWWNIPENRMAVDKGLEDIKAGRVTRVTLEDIRRLLEI